LKILFTASSVGIGLTFSYTRMVLALKKKGFDFVVVSDLGEEDVGLSDELKKEGIEYYKVKGLDNITNLHSIEEILRLIKAKNFDIIHTSGLIKLYKIHLANFLSGEKIPIVVNMESIEDETIARKAIYMASSPLLNLCTVIPVSLWTKRILTKYRVREDKMITIHNSIDLEYFDLTMSKKPLGYNFFDKFKGKTVIAQVSRLHPLKGHKYFLLAAKEILTQTTNVHFLIVGDGNLRRELQDMVADFGISEHVTFAGSIPNYFIPWIISKIDIGVLASLKEQFPRVLLEYMAAKKPVVTTNVGGITEAVSDGVNGYVVPPADYRSLAKAILNLISNPSMAKQMGNKNRKLVEEKFSMPIMADKLFSKCYLPLLENKSQ
jgi:glycosyltransferase involved in cell wall biosynthesis